MQFCNFKELKNCKPDPEFDIYRTAWGWVGVAGNQDSIRVIIPPLPSPEEVIEQLRCKTGPELRYHQGLFCELGKKLQRYFVGKPVSDWEVTIDLSGYPPFTRRVLQYTATIPYGRVQTYAEVATALQKPGAARAVGQALKRNLCPIVIPCHRVVGTREPGGFTAPGGIRVKQALLRLESGRQVTNT